MIKPVDSLIYLYYECTECGETGDCVPISVAKVNPYHVCPFCDNVDEIKPIAEVKIEYKAEVKKVDYDLKGEYLRKLRQSLRNNGYSPSQIEPALKQVINKFGMTTINEMYKQTILEMEDDKSTEANKT